MDEATIERLAAAAHRAHCVEYERQNGEPYWTGGDYEQLDGDAKEFARVTVRAVFKERNSMLEEERQERRDHPSYERWRNTKTEKQKG